VRNRVLLTAGIVNVFLQQSLVEQVLHPQAAAGHLIRVCRTDAARSGADLHPAGSILGRQFDHAMVRKDDMRAVADEEVAVHFHAGSAQSVNFFH
jgi:hypothetical protein